MHFTGRQNKRERSLFAAWQAARERENGPPGLIYKSEAIKPIYYRKNIVQRAAKAIKNITQIVLTAAAFSIS
jgi:hypothetical protein